MSQENRVIPFVDVRKDDVVLVDVMIRRDGEEQISLYIVCVYVLARAPST